VFSRLNRFNGSSNVEVRETHNIICIMRGRFIGFHDVFPSVDRKHFFRDRISTNEIIGRTPVRSRNSVNRKYRQTSSRQSHRRKREREAEERYAINNDDKNAESQRSEREQIRLILRQR